MGLQGSAIDSAQGRRVASQVRKRGSVVTWQALRNTSHLKSLQQQSVHTSDNRPLTYANTHA